MIRTLAIVAVAGLVLAGICFTGATALGWTGAWGQNGHIGFFEGFDDDDGNHSSGGPRGTREIPWDGHDDHLTFNLAGDVHYTQGDTAKITITGPERALDRITIEGGVIALPDHHRVRGKFDIQVTAPGVTRFSVNGPADLEIENYAQDELRIEVNGPGDITARGAAQRTEVVVHGPGDVDFSDIVGDEVHLQIMGPGDARIAPKKFADVTIMGPGDVDLNSDTAQIRSTIMGPGEVRRNGAVEKRGVAGMTLPAPRAPPAPPAAPAAPATPESAAPPR